MRIILWQINQEEDRENEINIWVTETKIVEFIQQVLYFCKPRIDTYAELVKDQATHLLILLASSDESNIASVVCKLEYNLIAIVSELMCSSEQSMPVRVNCCWVLSNFCAD